MKKSCLLMLALFTSLFAGFNSPNLTYLNPVIAAIPIKDLGIVNLIVEVSSINEGDGDKKIYKTDDFRSMMIDINVSIQSNILNIALNHPELTKDNLKELKKEMSDSILKIVSAKIKEYFPDKTVAISYEITSFYITSINTDPSRVKVRYSY